MEGTLSTLVPLGIHKWCQDNDNVSKVSSQGVTVIGSRVLGPDNVDMIIADMSFLQGFDMLFRQYSC